MTRRRVAVTGLGLVTPLGRSPEEVFGRLLAGESAVRPITRFDPGGLPTRIGAEVEEPLSADAGDNPPPPDRVARLASAAAVAAVADAGWPAAAPERCGLQMAAGLGAFAHREVFLPCGSALSDRGILDGDAYRRALQESLEPRSAERRSPGNLAARIAHRLDLLGPVTAVDTACAAGSQAVAGGIDWIRRGWADVVVAGGADSQLYPLGLASFCLLRVLSTRNHDPVGASRPFAADRDGFVMGEGAGMLVLEELGQARRRGARIYAEVAGIGSSSDAWRVTDPHPEGRGAVLAMRRALADAGVAPEAVGYVNAHGTSTVENDRIETLALRQVFGAAADRLAVSSTKSMIGHLTVAAGAVEAVVTALSLRRQQVHPTINLDVPDPECDLDYVPWSSRSLELEWALSNSFGFGGQCASLLFRRVA